MKLRSVEKAWRALWMRSIARALPGPGTAPTPDWGERPFNVLFLRYERIGDMIMATSLIREIATAHSTITLDVLAAEGNAGVLSNNPHVRDVIVHGGAVDSGRHVRARGYDAIVDGRINNPETYVTTPMIMLASGARLRIGAGGGRRDKLYNIRVAPYDRNDRETHFIEVCARLAEPFGVTVRDKDWRPQIFLSKREMDAGEAAWGGAPPKRLLVNLTAGDQRRRWPDERFVDVIGAVRTERPDIAVGVIGAPREWERVLAVALATGARALATPSVRDAFALVRAADVVFTPDTSVAHAASAFIRPCVVMLMEVHLPYAPYRTPGRVVTWSGANMSVLPVAPVLDAVRETVANHIPR